jgi:hypothetical protein
MMGLLFALISILWSMFVLVLPWIVGIWLFSVIINAIFEAL